MSTTKNTPQDIYAQLREKIDNVLQVINEDTEDSSVTKAKDNAREIFYELQKKINHEISELEKYAEWDTFTFAFYGETNAGKSTIIETLRILLNEQSKQEAQLKFKTLQKELGLTEECFLVIKEQIQRFESMMADVQQELDRIRQLQNEDLAHYRLELNELEACVKNMLGSMSVWRKFLSFFFKTREQKELVIKRKALCQREQENKFVVSDYLARIKCIEQDKLKSEQEYTTLQNNASRLVSYADGTIIGDGRSDFTVETHEYRFMANGKSFAILDVPGIEGKESTVIENIKSAVKKAHAVFYVTSKASAPQQGDESNQGTLQKIKEHLGAQTEVWTIYNKRITNPLQLQKDDLLSEDERLSLADLNEKMRSQLGDNYQDTLTLSAQAAFFSVAECLVPCSSLKVNKNKFISKLSTGELRNKSMLNDFSQFIVSDLMDGYQEKIIKSNNNKAVLLVNDVVKKIDHLNGDHFMPLAKKLEMDSHDCALQMDLALRSLKTRLHSVADNSVENLKRNVRIKIYDKIESDISNDDFKRALERYIKEEQEQCSQSLPEMMNAELERFQNEIGETVNRFERQSKDLFSSYGHIKSSKLGDAFELDIKIDNGIQIAGVLAAVAGGIALLIWNPVGWVIAAISIVSLVFGFVKSVIGFFSSSYKMSQQRKAADENLSRVSSQMSQSLESNIHAAFPELEQKVNGIKQAIDNTAKQIAGIVAIMRDSRVRLQKLIFVMDGKE
ncbi:TPA: hypothetical protein F3L22_04600 [Aeromonas hydrophila]|uniref:hypothetical protein n=1 Tax=Aeromonas caviae TaxID=648 RepID=UPI001A232640|nr:hypothetical protein [Aeromonas caviae]MEE1914379.1 hypothetical protein [Aeromonas caviae]HAU4887850.1 hypothetical protein [Aeromonas hydrophila]